RAGAARLEPRPAREHPRGRARRAARRLPRPPRLPGPARPARGAGRGRPRARRGRDPIGERAARAVGVNRYRWVVLAAGTVAAASMSAAMTGLAAIAPLLRSDFGLTLTQTGVVLGATGFGAVFTLLPWGLLADRIGERAVMAA